jgi:Tol biopolymer transport system component
MMVAISAGTRLGPYEILSPLGAGGMGEVWKARDTRLDRTVAIKLLPQAVAASLEARERFEREAKAIAKLSHPHICALYDVGREGDVEYLVMEHLEGETLANRLVRGPLSPEQTLRFGVEIAQALDRAHRQGIVHRDLKPGNVMLTKSGVKLLDFGLARAMAPAAQASPLSGLPTEAKALTAEGAILGTLQYMAPEQLEGKDTDARTDIFALGATLYEMATGRKAFSGGSQASLISSIMQSDPPSVSALSPMSPPGFDRIVRTCLAKDPEDRWQSAGDVAKELGWIAGGSADVAATARVRPGRSSRREAIAWVLALLATAFGAASLFLRRPAAGGEPSLRLMIAPPAGQSFGEVIQLSPDGRRIAFQLQDDGGTRSIAVRSFDSLEIRRLTLDVERGPGWSPDGRELAFFSGDRKIKRIAANGGPTQTICQTTNPGLGFSWGAQDTIIFPKDFGSPVFAVPASGGTPRPVTSLDESRGEVAHVHPAFLPDGRHFVFLARNIDPEKTTVMVGSLDGKDVRPLFHADSAAIYTDPGYLLFARDNALFAWRFDPQRLELSGIAAPVVEGVRYGTEDNRLSASARADRLAYLPWRQRKRLVWLDRSGRELGALGAVGDYEDVRLSPDGHRVAVAQRDPGRGQNVDVWVFEAGRGTGTRITTERSDEFDPVWYPDGQRIAYVSDHAGFYDLYERPAEGGAEKVLVRSKHDKVTPTISPDGRWLLYTVLQGGPNGPARYLASTDGKGEERRLTGTAPFSEEHAEMSPDGAWCAFESTESGEREVFVQPLADGPKKQVSAGGGRMPIWRRDGKELFYISRTGMLMSVLLRRAAGRLEADEPHPLFHFQLGIEIETQQFRRSYDASPDGQRFLVIRRAPDEEPDAAVVITNWRAALTGASK